MDEESKEKQIILVSNPEKRVPKLCTQVLFSLGSDGKIILTFIFQENMDDNGVVIERVMLPDNKQAKQISDKLNDVIKQSNKIIQDLY
jgi:hypothetical protein